MAEKLDEREVVGVKELLMSQMIPLDTVTQLLVQKGVITQEEFFKKLKEVQREYESSRGH